MSKFNVKKIALASVLKPVDDVRMTRKLAVSLAKVTGAEIHCIGMESKTDHYGSLRLHPLKRFARIGLGRLAAPWRVMMKLLQIRADLVIVCSHELLLPGVIVSLLQKSRLVYDVQENYFNNIRASKTFPWGLRTIVALYVRFKEIVLAPFVHHYFLAEQCYQWEMKYLPDRYTILENKSLVKIERVIRSEEKTRLLFSGTLAETTGVFIAIDLARLLHQVNPKITLRIVGYAPRQSTVTKIRQMIVDMPFIQLVTSDTPIPHETIVEAISEADAGIISYPRDPSTENCMPTKLFEYLAAELPILLINNPLWISRCAKYPAAVVFDPNDIDAVSIFRVLQQTEFYQIKAEDVLWKLEDLRFEI